MALNPVNYLTDVANPYTAAMQGYTQGTNLVAGIQQAEFDRQLAEQKRLAEQQKRADMQAFATLQNPTAKDYTAIMNQYPELSEQYKRSWDILDKDQKQKTLSSTSQVYAALSANQPLVAQQLLERQAEAALNSGDIETSKHLDALSQIVQQDPSLAQKQIGMFMSATSPDQFATMTKTLGEEQRSNQLQPYEIAQKQAQTGLTEAQTAKAQTENEYLPLEKQAGISNIESQIEDRTVGRVLEKEKMRLQNDQFYQKLDQDQAQFYENLNQEERNKAKAMARAGVENDEKRVARLEKAQNYATTAVNASETAKLAAKLVNDYKRLSDASGAGVWNAAMRNIPGTAEYDFSREVDTLKSQAFLIGAQNLKGLGAMTEMEGKKVTDALGNLDLSQQTSQVANQLASIAKSANIVAQTSNKNAQMYATKGKGYSAEVIEAAKQRGISPAEMQKIANKLGL